MNSFKQKELRTYAKKQVNKVPEDLDGVDNVFVVEDSNGTPSVPNRDDDADSDKKVDSDKVEICSSSTSSSISSRKCECLSSDDSSNRNVSSSTTTDQKDFPHNLKHNKRSKTNLSQSILNNLNRNQPKMTSIERVLNWCRETTNNMHNTDDIGSDNDAYNDDINQPSTSRDALHRNGFTDYESVGILKSQNSLNSRRVNNPSHWPIAIQVIESSSSSSNRSSSSSSSQSTDVDEINETTAKKRPKRSPVNNATNTSVKRKNLGEKRNDFGAIDDSSMENIRLHYSETDSDELFFQKRRRNREIDKKIQCLKSREESSSMIQLRYSYVNHLLNKTHRRNDLQQRTVCEPLNGEHTDRSYTDENRNDCIVDSTVDDRNNNTTLANGENGGGNGDGRITIATTTSTNDDDDCFKIPRVPPPSRKYHVIKKRENPDGTSSIDCLPYNREEFNTYLKLNPLTSASRLSRQLKKEKKDEKRRSLRVKCQKLLIDRIVKPEEPKVDESVNTNDSDVLIKIEKDDDKETLNCKPSAILMNDNNTEEIIDKNVNPIKLEIPETITATDVDDEFKSNVKLETKGSRCSGLLTKLEPNSNDFLIQPNYLLPQKISLLSEEGDCNLMPSIKIKSEKSYAFEKFSYLSNVTVTNVSKARPAIRYLVNDDDDDDDKKEVVKMSTETNVKKETTHINEITDEEDDTEESGSESQDNKIRVKNKKLSMRKSVVRGLTKPISLNKRRTFKTKLIQRTRNLVYSFRDKFRCSARLRNGKQRKDMLMNLKLKKRIRTSQQVQKLSAVVPLQSPPKITSNNKIKTDVKPLPKPDNDINKMLLTSEPILEKIPADMPVPFSKDLASLGGASNESPMSILYSRVSTDSAIGGSVLNSPSSLVTDLPTSTVPCAGSIPSNFITNPLDIRYGEIITVYYVDTLHLVVVVQENLISFWKYRPLVLVFGASQLWKNCGSIKRDNNDIEIKTQYQNKFAICEDTIFYIELKGKIIEPFSRECDLTSIYINVYFKNLKTSLVDWRSIQLDSIYTLPGDLCFTVLKNSRYFFMGWSEKIMDRTKSALCKYCLTPDLETLASIRDFPIILHDIKSLQQIEDTKIIGIGSTAISIWDQNTANLLNCIDLNIPLGVNMTSYVTFEETEKYLFLMQIIDSSLKLIAIRIDDEFTYRIVQSFTLPLDLKIPDSTTKLSNLILSKFPNNCTILVTLNNFQNIYINHHLNDNSLIFPHGDYITEIGEFMAVKSASEYLFDAKVE